MSTFYNTNIDIAEYNKWTNKYANDIRNLSEEQKKNAFLRYQYRMKQGESALGAFDKAKTFDEKVALYNGQQNINQVQQSISNTSQQQTVTPSRNMGTSATFSNSDGSTYSIASLGEPGDEEMVNPASKAKSPFSLTNPYYQGNLNNTLGIDYNKKIDEYQHITQQLESIGSIDALFKDPDILKNPDAVKKIALLYRRKDTLEKEIQDAMAINQAIADRKLSVNQPKDIYINPEQDVYIGKDGKFIFDLPRESQRYSVGKNGKIDKEALRESISSGEYEANEMIVRPYQMPQKAYEQAEIDRLKEKSKHKKIKDLTKEEWDEYIKQYNDHYTTVTAL